MYNKGDLDRIVFDESHVLVTMSEFRTVLPRIRKISVPCQVVCLTASLPPSPCIRHSRTRCCSQSLDTFVHQSYARTYSTLSKSASASTWFKRLRRMFQLVLKTSIDVDDDHEAVRADSRASQMSLLSLFVSRQGRHAESLVLRLHRRHRSHRCTGCGC